MKRTNDSLPVVRLISLWRKALRGVTSNPLTSYYKHINSIKHGSKISRIGRHIFEHKHARRVLGSNLALLVLASSFVPSASSYYTGDYELNVYESTTSTLSTTASIRKPLDYLYVNQGYHFFHLGIDFEGDTGDPVYSIMGGVVVTTEYSLFSYGNSVVIDHQNGYTSRYAHLSKIRVNVGDSVNADSIIGDVGSTGRSSGDHLHLEVYENGRNINPFSLIPRE